MPRTTIDLDAALIEQLKTLAARQRISMSRLTARLLREALRREREEGGRPRPFRWQVSESGPAPGFDPANRDYLDVLDEPD